MSIPAIILRVLCCLMFAGTAMAQTGQAPVETVQPYRLQAGDVLEITVWKEEGLAREAMIAPDGTIAFPLVGQVQAQGLTVEQLQQDLGERIGRFIPQPSVTVILMGAKGSKFYVIGKVNRPGDFPLLGPVSVLQALSMAGGIATFADYNSIKIIRRENGQEKSIPFRYGDMEKGRELAQNIMLMSGDVVVVP